jgi:hypothetical protein
LKPHFLWWWTENRLLLFPLHRRGGKVVAHLRGLFWCSGVERFFIFPRHEEEPPLPWVKCQSQSRMRYNIMEGQQGREATDDFVEDLISDEPYAIGEVSAIVEKLTEAFQELSHNLRKPNSTNIFSSSQFSFDHLLFLYKIIIL